MILQTLSKLYTCCLPILKLLPSRYQVKIASSGRTYYMQRFIHECPTTPFIPPTNLAKTMWGIHFRSPLGNAAGMFKGGDGYDTVASLGAGAYLGGTSTANPRNGNSKDSVKWPFISLIDSKTSLNWLGLPNAGDAILAQKTFTKQKIAGCPIGWSVMRSPDFDEKEGLQQLINSLNAYSNNPQIDFIEINESCPNIKASSDNILPRLEYIAQHFLQKRSRHLPVIVKLSTDINNPGLAKITETLIRLGYDGLNLGNTSTAYQEILPFITPKEQELFTFFTNTFGGGVSGFPLKQRSLDLCMTAAQIIEKLKPNHEFHIIRTGGIDCYADIIASQQCGVSFNQWYTGFFHNYQLYGNDIYKSFFAI